MPYLQRNASPYSNMSYRTMPFFTLQSALLLTEVLKERDAQVELKKLKEKMNNGADRDLREKAEKEYHEFLQKDLEEKRRQAEMNKMTAEFQKAQ